MHEIGGGAMQEVGSVLLGVDHLEYPADFEAHVASVGLYFTHLQVGVVVHPDEIDDGGRELPAAACDDQIDAFKRHNGAAMQL